MSEDVPERVEDYLELDQYIERLNSQEFAPLPANLTPQQTSIYGMAKLFHAASPRIADPRPEFKEQLRQRLLTQMRDEGQGPSTSQSYAESTALQENQSPPQPLDADHVGRKGSVRKRRIPFSRRTLFAGGTVAAASLLGAAAAGAAIEHSLEPQPDLNPHIRGEAWLPVASLEQLGDAPIRFTTNTISGYIIRPPENTSEEAAVIAFSAACTHLGCLVQWQADKRQFPCPCHGRTFDATGDPVYNEDSKPHYASLPRLDTKIENGHIYVKVPV
jgi:Rieske Fe-S protein